MPARLAVVGLVLVLVLAWAAPAAGHYPRPRPAGYAALVSWQSHLTLHAALFAFCGGNNRVCAAGLKAHAVADCETGGTFNPWATNGQYRGLWQMGATERRRCGETWGRDPWTQARAARCWHRLAGWDAWDCA